jgi:hypothetical protein
MVLLFEAHLHAYCVFDAEENFGSHIMDNHVHVDREVFTLVIV